ncbi:MAG: hypothetical protein ACK4M4_08870 [Flavobacterium sp.]
MKKNTITDLSDEKLLQREKSLKGVLIGFGILFIIAIGTMMSLYANKPFNPVLFVPSFIFPFTMLAVFVQYNSIKTEKKSRNI